MFLLFGFNKGTQKQKEQKENLDFYSPNTVLNPTAQLLVRCRHLQQSSDLLEKQLKQAQGSKPTPESGAPKKGKPLPCTSR